MKKVSLLDCTLRDGGYCNEWKFGYDNICYIVKGLLAAEIDIIECGFLTQKEIYTSDFSKFNSMEAIQKVLPQNRNGKIYVVMINYGEYDIEFLPECQRNGIDGIRVAFHKKDYREAIEMCKKIKDKGYKVFVQPMVSLNYSDVEFLSLLQLVNELHPYAFYLVDSFGMMKRNDLLRLFYIVQNNLKEDIIIGFHSHNNMQLAYANAQALIEAQASRTLIIDTSIFGMGRGAGNLNTELMVEYLNENFENKYFLKPILNIIDKILNNFYLKNYWGYSLPNYLSAQYAIHPNYASCLADKNTLTIEAMDAIFKKMDKEKSVEFDKEYIEKLYHDYMSSGFRSQEKKTNLYEMINGKEILLIAPGKSTICEKEKIIEKAQQDNLVKVSINHAYLDIDTNYIFVSNLRRYAELSKKYNHKCIITSNLGEEQVYYKVDYDSLTNNVEGVSDNAGIMAIRFFINMGAHKVCLAGFDGYFYDSQQNYAKESFEMVTQKEVIDKMNKGMEIMLKKFKEEIDIEFITTTRYCL